MPARTLSMLCYDEHAAGKRRRGSIVHSRRNSHLDIVCVAVLINSVQIARLSLHNLAPQGNTHAKPLLPRA